MKKLMILAMVVAAAINAWAESVSTNGYTWTYSVSGGKATLGNGVSIATSPSPVGMLEIPPVLGGYQVTAIADYAFSGCTELTEVIVPTGVTSIGYRTFYCCDNLARIKIPESVTYMGYQAFWGDNNLDALYIDSLASWCCVRFGSQAGNPLCYAHKLYVNGELVTHLEIPESITQLNNYAFRNDNPNLKGLVFEEITLHDNLVSIGKQAFLGCKFSKVNIPQCVCSSSLVSIFPDACCVITNVVISESVTTIGASAFAECENLSSVQIPAGITSIGATAFADCATLSRVTLPSDIGSLTIGAHAFDDSTSVGVESRQGYSLLWTNATGTVIFDPFHSSTAVTVSPYWVRSSPSSATPLDFSDGLVAHYAFDSSANDSSGNGNNGILHFGVGTTADRHGKAGSAYHFDGTSGYVEVPDSDSLNKVGQQLTISAWVKPEAWDRGWISVLCKGDAEKSQYALFIGPEQWGVYRNSNGIDVMCNTTKSVALDNWSFVAVTYSPTLIAAYLNGELVGTVSPNGNTVENTNPLYLGIDPPGSVECFAGDMDEVRIYNRCLSASEIRALANGDNPVASDIGNGHWFYRFDVDGGVGIAQTGIGQFTPVLNIPDMIEGESVVAIGRYGFTDNGDITMVTIPASVSEIGDSAFAGCANLTRVMLSCDIGALTVGGNAFDANTEVKIAGRSGWLFCGWTNALGVAVVNPFHGSTTETVAPVWRKAGTAEFDGRIWTYSISDDGSLTIGNGIDVAVFPIPSGNFSIPTDLNGCPIVGVAANAFKDCVDLTSLTIPSNVTRIGVGAFDGCSGLTNIVIESEGLYTAGLMQTRFETRFDTASTLGDATNSVSSVSGAIAAYTKVTAAPWEFSDPLTGRTFVWPDSYSTMAYFGQMYFKSGNVYVFGSHFDDDAFIKVGGDVLISVKDIDTSNKQPDEVATGKQIFMGQYACMSSGWYDVEFRLSDIGLGKGSWGNIWSDNFGLGYRDDGGTSTIQSEWSRLLDSGDGSLLRFKGAVFAGCSNVVSVTMPWSLVTRMSVMLPDAYRKLASVMLTGDAGTIPENAFAGCASLRSFGSCSEPVVVTNFVDVVVFVTNTVTDVVSLTNIVTQTVVDTVTDYVTLTNVVVETNFVDVVETNFVDVVTTNTVTDVVMLTNIVTQTVVDTVTDYITLTNVVVETNFVDVVETNSVDVVMTNTVTDVVTLTNIVTQTIVDTVTDYVTLTNVVAETNFVDIVETNFVVVVATNVVTDVLMLTNIVTQTVIDTVTDYVTATNWIAATNLIDVAVTNVVTDLVEVTNVTEQIVLLTNFVEIAEEAAIVPDEVQIFEPEEEYTGTGKKKMSGVVFGMFGVMHGVVHLEISSAAKGVSAKGFVMLNDGKKTNFKGVLMQMFGGKLGLTASVGKLGVLQLSIGGDGFKGVLGGMKVVSAEIGPDVGVLSGTLTLKYLDATGKIKSRKLAVGGVATGGTAAGTVTPKGSSKTRQSQAKAFAAEFE